MSDQNGGGWSDDVISLEDLVGGGDSAPSSSASGAPPSEPQHPPESSPPQSPVTASDAAAGVSYDLDSLDRTLASEDPNFAASLREVHGEGGAADVDIDSIDIGEIIREHSLKGRRRIILILFRRPYRRVKEFAGSFGEKLARLKTWLMPLFRDGAKAGFVRLKQGLLTGFGKLKELLARFAALPKSSKLLMGAILLLAMAFFVVVRITFHGAFMPELKPGFLNSFAEVADKRYEYDPQEAWEEFNNPLLQPESVVLLDRVVVNLRPPGDGSNPMGMFEIYVEGASHEAAVELKDREVEARDTISRTLERISYDELLTAEGKNKLKLILRKDLNAFLTQGRVRKVYFKTVVLKP